MITYEKFDSAMDLPAVWDEHCLSYFQTREFLSHCQSFNPCKQRYYLLFKDKTFLCGAVVYTLRLDLLTFLKIPSPLTMRICGIPCSVSSGGITGEQKYNTCIAEKIKEVEKGLVLFLNNETAIDLPRLSHGRTWPTIELQNSFKTWDEYCHSLRSEYRRRIIQIESFCSEITFSRAATATFSDLHYQQYKNVYNRSKGKLELLSKDFFKNLPESFSLTEIYYKQFLAGWTIVNNYKNSSSFFLGGQDYKSDSRSIYLAKLYHIVRDAIEYGYQFIDLGQSAEVPKMRFGGIVKEKHMSAYHSNKVLNKILHSASGLLSYNIQFANPSVFKGHV